MRSHKPHFEGLQRSARSRWIAVGDSGRFLIFDKKRGEPLSLVKRFDNESAHQKISDFTRGQPGRSYDSFSSSHGGHQTAAPRHAYSSEQDPKERAIENFLREVSSYLESASSENTFENLVLITNNRVLGKLRPLLGKGTQARICEEHDKDFAWVSGPELTSRVEDLLALS